MKGRYFDGVTARPHPVDAAIDGADLVFHAGAAHRWPLAALNVETVDDHVRVARQDGGSERLSLELAEWRAATEGAKGYHRSLRRRHRQLVAVLTASAAAVAAAVFVGIPAASGPLARATPPALERQIGENFEGQLALAFKPCAGAEGQAALQGLGTRLGGAAPGAFDIRVKAVEAPMVNAFALPGGSIMVTGDLIALARSPDELSAVIAHEAAHVRERHVMQAVWRSFGFGVLLDAVVGGGTGAGQQAVLLFGSLTNLRYGREAEAEADARGQALLHRLGLSSEGLAPFFRRLANAKEGPAAAAVAELLSDHPDSLSRADDADARARTGRPAFTPAEWKAIKAACAGGPDPFRRLKDLI